MSNHQITLREIQSLLDTTQLASLGPEPRFSREPFKMLDEKLGRIFSETKVSLPVQPLIRSLILLWHDYLDESHSISQNIHGADGSFLHGIMHRREPDYGNAKYWFHRVGEHACYPMIASKAAEVLDKTNADTLKAKLIRSGNWDAFAFIDACEKALRNRNQQTIALLQQIQEIEFRTLLNHFLSSKDFPR